MKRKTDHKDKDATNRVGTPKAGQKRQAPAKEFEKATSTQPNKKPAEKRLGDDSEIDDETTI